MPWPSCSTAACSLRSRWESRVAGAIALVAVGTIVGAAGGVALGIAVAFVLANALRRRPDAAIQIGATIICAYGAYFAADSLRLSGIFATIAFGIALRYYERSWITLRHRG